MYESRPLAHWSPRLSYQPKADEWFWCESANEGWMLRQGSADGKHALDECGVQKRTLNSYKGISLPAQGPESS